jgi:Tfp pilus assembly protein PilX
MKIKKYKQSEKGFALALALIMLLVMSLMGATLVMVAANDHKKNAIKDSNQQAFYAAETGITEAKKWLTAQSSLSANNDPSSKLKFCKTSSFSNLGSPKAINNYVENKSLDQIISVSGDEKKRLEKYSYEFFITYTPDQNGNTSTARTKTVAGSTGSSVAEGASYKSGGTSTGTHYTIFSCGCNAAGSKCKQGNNTIVNLIADVVLVQ